MPTIIFRGYRTDPDDRPQLFIGASEMEAEQKARDYVKTRHPWRDEDEEPGAA